MKVLAVPDTHGNPNTLEIAKKHETEVEKIVFLGDYVDSHVEGNNWLQQKKCLENILDFKKEINKKTKSKVVTLLGNHDICYIPKWGASTNVSGHQYFQAADIQEYLCEYFDEFKAIEVVDRWIFSHAGVSKTWLKRHKTEAWAKVPDDEKKWSLATVNKVFKAKQLQYFNHNVFDPYGNDEDAGCMWIRPQALISFGVKGYHQVVGHTNIDDEELETGEDYWGLKSRVMTFGDLPVYKTFAHVRPKNYESKYVFIDSIEQNHFAIVNTETNDVLIDVL